MIAEKLAQDEVKKLTQQQEEDLENIDGRSDVTSQKSYRPPPVEHQQESESGPEQRTLLVQDFFKDRTQNDVKFIVESETTSEDDLDSHSDSEEAEKQLNQEFAAETEAWRAQGLTERMIKAKLRELKKGKAKARRALHRKTKSEKLASKVMEAEN